MRKQMHAARMKWNRVLPRQALWLGVEPPDLLLYVFLPPILLDSAARIEFFVFKKVHACAP